MDLLLVIIPGVVVGNIFHNMLENDEVEKLLMLIAFSFVIAGCLYLINETIGEHCLWIISASLAFFSFRSLLS